MSDLEKAARMALEAMGLIGADLVCDAAHHKKADRHGIGEPCPIQARWHHAFAALLQALSNRVEQPAQQEPVAWVDVHDYTNLYYRKPAQVDVVPLYYGSVTPPAAQRQWVGLTDDELEIINDCGDTDSYKFARAIEAKLKEKNCA